MRNPTEQIFNTFLAGLLSHASEFRRYGVPHGQWVLAIEKPARMVRAIAGAVAKLEVDPPMCEMVDGQTIRVNLDAVSRYARHHTVTWSRGWGWVTVQRRGDDLYVDGTRVLLRGFTNAKDMEPLLHLNDALHPNILHALMEHPHLIPQSWKAREGESSLYVYFWGEVYDNEGSQVRVPYMVWHGHRWQESLSSNGKYGSHRRVALLPLAA